MSTRGCRRPNVHEDDRLCFCPVDGKGYGPRQVLAQNFINGWIGEGLMSAANALAKDEKCTEERLWSMLFQLEERANDAYEMWTQTC